MRYDGAEVHTAFEVFILRNFSDILSVYFFCHYLLRDGSFVAGYLNLSPSQLQQSLIVDLTSVVCP